MTTTTAAHPSTEVRLPSLLRADAAVTAVVGLLLLLTPTSWYGELPAALVRGAGAVFVLAGVEVALLARSTGRRLRLVATVVGELALATAVALVVAVEVGDVRGAGLEVLGLTALACVGFGVAELRAVRRS